MSVCAKLQLSSWSRSGWIVCVGWGGGGEHVATMSNSNAFAELRWVLTIGSLSMINTKSPNSVGIEVTLVLQS